jgi:hypothetical protein
VEHPPTRGRLPLGHQRDLPDRYLTVDDSTPGQIVVFNRNGNALWTYRPTGAAQLSRPSLALPLPGGDIFAVDDAPTTIIVVEPRTNSVPWPYGHKAPGRTPGVLGQPRRDGPAATQRALVRQGALMSNTHDEPLH